MRQIDLPTILSTHNDILLTSALLPQLYNHYPALRSAAAAKNGCHYNGKWLTG